ncbi:MAG TPA: methyltransferase domain-containing protein [Candidatus Limnocylindrales bacterium]
MADLPLELPGGLADRLAQALDQEGKIPRALDALGPLGGREVALVDGAGGIRARSLASLLAPARLLVVERRARLAALRAALADLTGEPPGVEVLAGKPEATGIADGSVDAVVGLWSAFRAPADAAAVEADRILRPGGRLLVVQDYGRDHVSLLLGDLPEYREWGRRGGWYMRNGFRLRVVHCFWTFATLEDARGFLREAFPKTGPAVADSLKRPRLTYNVAVYHRTRGEGAGAVAKPAP